MVRKEKTFIIVLALLLCSANVLAQERNTYAQQERINTGVGLVVTGGVVAAPLSVFLLAGNVPGGIIPGVIVGGVSIVALSAGVFEIVTGVQQRPRVVSFGLTGVTIRF